jgi:uncharacterized protein (DUF885 family)
VHRREFLSRSASAGIAAGVLARTPALAEVRRGADAGFVALRDGYFMKTLELYPVVSTNLGGGGLSPRLELANGRLRDFRPAAIAAELAAMRGFARDAERVDAAALSPTNRVDGDVLAAQVGFVLHLWGDLRYHERCVDTYVAEPFRGVDWQLQQMTDAGSGLLGTAREWDLVVARLGAVPAYLAAAKANLLAGKRDGNMPDRRMVLLDGVNGSRANAQYFRTTLLESAKRFLGSRPFAASALGRLDAAARGAADAYAAFAVFLGQTYDRDEKTDRFAAGEKEYAWRVANCLREDRSVEALYAYGAEQVALYEERLVEAAREVAADAKLGLAFGTDAERRASVAAVASHLANDSPKDDDELFRWYRETGERAVAYGRDRGLFDIPAQYKLDVVATPPVLRSTIDAAYYAAPPFKRSGVGRFYLTPTDNDPGALKLNNRASVADTAIHEGFPGHDWHYKYMTEHAREISNVRWLTPGEVEGSASMWEDSMAAEGWGLYAEELMSEPAADRPHGFYTAAEYVYELQGQLLRAVRVRVDTGIHTGRMTFDEAVDYFTEHVSFTPGACARATGTNDDARAVCDQARRAIYRYSKWPTQAITYNLGKNAIVALREEYKAKTGARYSPKSFHEKFMRMGTIPVRYFHDEFLAES